MYSAKGILATLPILASLILPPSIARGPESIPPPQVALIGEARDQRNKHQSLLDHLIRCESNGNKYALNPRDTNGLASHGILQFQESTFFQFVQKYEILPDIERGEVLNVIYDSDLQIRIFNLMVKDSDVDLSKQFPTCYKLWKAR